MSPETTTTVAPPEPSTAESGNGDVSSIDLIIELYKRDVDRTLLIEQLRKTPAQRADDLESACDCLNELPAAMARARLR